MSGLVHGTTGALVAADWPPLTRAELSAALADVLPPVRAVAWTSPRPLSAAALVDTSAGRVFVKRHAQAVRTRAALDEEHAFARHLRARGLPVPAVLAVAETARWVYEVHEVGVGEDPYRDVHSWQPHRSPAHAHATGAVLARVASAGASHSAPARPPRLLVTSWSALRCPDLPAGLAAFVAARPALARALQGRPWRRDVAQVLAPLHARLRPHLPGLTEGWTHGDGHPSNLLWQGDRVTAVLDLGLCDRTTPLLDLATAVERACVSWLDPVPRADLALVDALLAGWRGERDDDLAPLADLLPLAHLEFALSELAYFAEVTRSRRDADAAYAYAVGHARWYGSPAGRQLLAHLRLSAGRLP